jgi:cell envelope opacity-associated protein A
MKDEKAPSTAGGFGPDYVGWSVPIIATAYVMANTYEEAQFKVNRALRMQARVMLTKIETLQPVQTAPPEDIENIPLPTFTRQDVADLKVHDLMAKQADEGLRPVETPRVVPTNHPAAPPYVVCSAHKKDVHKRCACTPGETCHADYWSAKLKGK